MPVFFSFFASFKIRCLSLYLLNMKQRYVIGPDLGLFFFTRPYSVTSINFYVTLYSQFIRNDILDFFLHASHISLSSSFIPFIQKLFLRDLSSNSINFTDTSSTFKISSSMDLTSVFKIFISFFTQNSSSSIFFFFFLRKFQTSS